MLDSALVECLKAAGLTYRPAESPVLWTHLESRFSGERRMGSRFDPLPSSFVAEVVALGESLLLQDFATAVRAQGRVERVRRVMTMPYLVGVEALRPRGEVNASHVLPLIALPGERGETLIHVVPTAADALPVTNKVTVEGGPYADGRTVGYYNLHPGALACEVDAQDLVILATAEEIRALARAMREHREDVVSASPSACEAMAVRALRALDQQA